MPDDVFDLKRWNPRGPSLPSMPFSLVRLALVAIAAIVILATMFYQVQPEAVGVVLRFGRYVRTCEPGLHMKLPLVESVTRVPVQRQLKQEFGFRTEEPAVRTRYATGNFKDESMMLTGDLNVAIVEWIVH